MSPGSFDPAFGAAGDTKLRDSLSSWHVPSSRPPGVRELSTNDLDERLAKYHDVITDRSTPVRRLEIVKNDLEAAAHVEERMRILKIPATSSTTRGRGCERPLRCRRRHPD